MSFSESVKTCFRKYVTFSGRAPRAEYWYFWLFYLIASIILFFLNSALFGPETIVTEETVFAADGSSSIEREVTQSYNGGLIGTIFTVVTFLPGVAVAWRRMHDAGRSGWWILAPFAISFATIMSLILNSIGWSAMIEALSETGHVTVQSGSGALIGLAVFIVSFLMLLFWLCAKSQPGQNKYGPNPYEVAK